MILVTGERKVLNGIHGVMRESVETFLRLCEPFLGRQFVDGTIENLSSMDGFLPYSRMDNGPMHFLTHRNACLTRATSPLSREGLVDDLSTLLHLPYLGDRKLFAYRVRTLQTYEMARIAFRRPDKKPTPFETAAILVYLTQH